MRKPIKFNFIEGLVVMLTYSKGNVKRFCMADYRSTLANAAHVLLLQKYVKALNDIIIIYSNDFFLNLLNTAVRHVS